MWDVVTAIVVILIICAMVKEGRNPSPGGNDPGGFGTIDR